MMFCHQGQQNMKELRFHPQFACLMATTAEDSFNVFRPNLEPVDDKNENLSATANGVDNVAMMSGTEETKQDTFSAAEECKR